MEYLTGVNIEIDNMKTIESNTYHLTLLINRYLGKKSNKLRSIAYLWLESQQQSERTIKY